MALRVSVVFAAVVGPLLALGCTSSSAEPLSASAGALERAARTELDYQDPSIRAITSPENITDIAGRIRTDFTPLSTPQPEDVMTLSVRHMGRPCTSNLVTDECRQSAEAVANPIHWDVGMHTGFRPPAPVGLWQFGYTDSTPAIGANAFQLRGTSAGVMINTWSFDHGVPVVGGGPNVVLAINYARPQTPFVHASSELTLQAVVRLPWATSWKGGVGQLSFFFYLRDRTTGQSFAYVAGIWDSRAAGDGNGTEFVGHDTQVSFVSSPLRAGTRFTTVSPFSHSFRNTATWTTDDFFRVHVSGRKLVDAIGEVERAHGAALSKRPSDYELTSAGILQEVFVGTDPTVNMSMGASFTDFSVYEFY